LWQRDHVKLSFRSQRANSSDTLMERMEKTQKLKLFSAERPALQWKVAHCA
jgi:hypothetical protein